MPSPHANSPLQLRFFLADHAQVAGGKLFVSGGGWTWTLSAAGNAAIAGLITVPWTETNRRRKLTIKLLSADGAEVRVPTPIGEQPFVLAAEFEAGRPPGMTPGIDIVVPIGVNIARPPLRPGRYQFRVEVDDAPTEVLSFDVLEQPPPGGVVG